MTPKIFVNLPVKDLDKSKTFFTKIGLSFNPQFSDATAACMVISDDIYSMLITHEKFKEFTKKEIADATRITEVLITLSADNREKVNEFVDKAILAGATETRDPHDYGYMFGRSFNDLDGHIWEVFWMDPASITKD